MTDKEVKGRLGQIEERLDKNKTNKETFNNEMDAIDETMNGALADSEKEKSDIPPPPLIILLKLSVSCCIYLISVLFDFKEYNCELYG